MTPALVYLTLASIHVRHILQHPPAPPSPPPPLQITHWKRIKCKFFFASGFFPSVPMWIPRRHFLKFVRIRCQICGDNWEKKKYESAVRESETQRFLEQWWCKTSDGKRQCLSCSWQHRISDVSDAADAVLAVSHPSLIVDINHDLQSLHLLLNGHHFKEIYIMSI
jgi:hypothetical protein